LFAADEPKDTDQLNAIIAARYQTVALAQIRAELKRSLQDLVQTLEGFSDADLVQPDGLARLLNNPALEYVAGDSYEHIEDHLTSLQRWRDR
jgi:hypothetical protein